MEIGINATAAFKQPRTGVERYTYQLIKSLAMLEQSKKHRFILYIPYPNFESDFKLPANFQIKPLRFEIKRLHWNLPMWTQVRLTSEMVAKKPEQLFIPVHTLPFVHPKKSVVTIHGLEYEYYPQLYPKNHLRYLRWSTKYALKNASQIIAVSENTKKDLVKLYKGDPDKIKVVYHGIETPTEIEKNDSLNYPYILYIGRLETKKNVQGLIEAFNLLKTKFKIPHKLILIGPPGYGYEKVALKLADKNIIWKNYVSEEEKWTLLKQASVFAMPSFYEGFGMPIIEAQAVSTPVVTANVSSMPEVTGTSAVLVDPQKTESIAEGIYRLIKDEALRKEMIILGQKNVQRFSWAEAASETLKILETD